MTIMGTGLRPAAAARAALAAAARAAIAVAACAAGLAPPAAAQDTPPTYRFRDAPIAWAPCPDAPIDGLDCATYAVPRDYRDPDGPTFELALRRMRAQGGAAQGTLFFNPGGPGGTGTVQFPEWYGLFPERVRAAFDIVSWDPRGVGQSTQARCFADDDAEAALIGDLGAFPVTYAAQAAWTDAYARFAQACAANAADVAAHLSTADTARDLEQLRRASGGAPLTYWGVSYGTFLGATYANMFPNDIRALVLDGNLSPLAWTADGDPDPQTTVGDRIGSDEVAQVMDHFLQLCAAAGPELCAFAEPGYPATRRKWDALLDRLALGPVELRTAAGTRSIDLSTLVGQVSDGLDIVWPVPGSAGWPAIAAALQKLHEAAATPPAPQARPMPTAAAPEPRPAPGPAPSDAPATSTAATSTAATPAPAAPAAYDGAEGVIAIMCGDGPAVRLDRFPTLASEAMLRTGYFGLSTSFVQFPCAAWSVAAADPYRGPWDTPLSAKPLVVNTTHDPSTPMRNAEAMARLLPGATLLRVNGYGHTTLLNASACASDAIAAYLVDLAPPAPGAVCAQDRQPFQD